MLKPEVGRKGYSGFGKDSMQVVVRPAGSEYSLIISSEFVHTGRAPSTVPYGLQLLVHDAAWNNKVREIVTYTTNFYIYHPTRSIQN